MEKSEKDTADALRCGLTVPFQATAGEASP